MATRLYVGNLPFDITDSELETAFAPFGRVTAVSIITDRETGRPRGFGFVDLENGAEQAIAALDNTEFGGRRLKVNVAQERQGGAGRGAY